LTAFRYHSLVIEEDSFPAAQLEVTAWIEDGLVMGVRHRVYKHIQGLQFHPESIMTQNGMQIVGNFLKMLDRKEAADEEIEAKVLETA
jgi:anthranilate synthase component 2